MVKIRSKEGKYRWEHNWIIDPHGVLGAFDYERMHRIAPALHWKQSISNSGKT